MGNFKYEKPLIGFTETPDLSATHVALELFKDRSIPSMIVALAVKKCGEALIINTELEIGEMNKTLGKFYNHTGEL